MIVLVALFILALLLQGYRFAENWENMRWGNVAAHPRRGRAPFYAPH